MSSRTVLIPTFIGHIAPVTTLAESIRTHCGNNVDIVLVIGSAERSAFEEMAYRHSCQLLEFEDLLYSFTRRRLDTKRLLATVDRFRFQSLKKLLGVASLSGDVLVMDSESLVMRDLTSLFDGGIAETTVAYSERPWHTITASLSARVYDECCQLLGQQPYWYFESFNWLYSSDIVRNMLQHLQQTHGVEWMFRPRDLFECQLYFQYVHMTGAGYRFLPAQEILAGHFGPSRAANLLQKIYNSPLLDFGIFEYLARFVGRDEYIGFVADPRVLRHFRLMRHEPYEFYDIVGAVREAAGSDPNYFGEASMHRRPLLSGRIAVIASGRFYHEEDVYSLRHFLRGVDCDLFLGIGSGDFLEATIQEILQPRAIAAVDDAAELGARSLALQNERGVPEPRIKAGRDLGSMAMFEKMAAAWGAMAEEETVRGRRYSVVVRVRPDIFARRGLRDILWDISENMSNLKGSVMTPDSFWSQGINDQIFLGLRDEMGCLLERVSGAAYADCEFRNPEYFLGSCLRSAGLAPVPFPFEYILTRADRPELEEVQHRLDEQASHFWSAKSGLPVWKDAGAALDEKLTNVRLKNGLMNAAVLPMAGGPEADVCFLSDSSGYSWMLFSEHKSPAIYLLKLAALARPFVPLSLATGLLRRGRGRPARLESFDTATGQVELSVGSGESTAVKSAALTEQEEDGRVRIRLQIKSPPRSALVAVTRWSLKAAGAVFKRVRRNARRTKRFVRDIRARWALAGGSRRASR